MLCAIMWLMCAWKCILDRKIPEALSLIKYLLRLFVLAPEYKLLLIKLIELQGKLNYAFENYEGALKAFERVRDIAQDIQNHKIEKDSYVLMA